MASRRSSKLPSAILSNVSFAGLCALETVLRTGSFRAAAQELKISVSSLSQSMARLKRDLGLELLRQDYTDGRRRVTTVEGEKIAQVVTLHLPLLSRELRSLQQSARKTLGAGADHGVEGLIGERAF